MIDGGDVRTAINLKPNPSSPVCITNLAPNNFGFTSFDPKELTASVDNSGPANGCDTAKQAVDKLTCQRPLVPGLFVTDITANPQNRAGDWQQGSIF